MMKKLAFTFSLLSAISAQAFLGGSDTEVIEVFPCIGLDGIPITSGTMEQQCCTGGHLNANAANICRSGFNTISGDTAGGAASNITLAQQALGTASTLYGVESNQSTTNVPTSGVNTSNPTRATSSGLVSGGNTMNNDGAGLSGASLAGNGRGSGGSGAGGAGAGGGASSGGFSGLDGGGTGSGDGKNGAGAVDPNADANKPLGGGFASNGGSGKGGGSGFGGMDMNFGNNGNGGADGQGNGLDELGFGDDALAEGEAGSDVEGTIHDPANYFSLTNKGDNLFKIVSRRYTKKWKKLVSKDKARLPAHQQPGVHNKPL